MAGRRHHVYRRHQRAWNCKPARPITRQRGRVQCGGHAAAGRQQQHHRDFDTSQIGGRRQYQNFGLFEKTGTGTWTLTGTPGQATPWTISQGTLAITSDSNLGTAGETLTFNGGTLQLALGLPGH